MIILHYHINYNAMKCFSILSSLVMFAFMITVSCSSKTAGCPVCGRDICVCDRQGNNGQEDPLPEPTGSSLIILKDGKMLFPDGNEARLYGVNFQTPVSWEFNRLSNVGIQKNAESLHKVTDNNLDDLQLLGVNHLRCHLTPCDLTDEKGNLMESSVFLDALDYLVNEAAKKSMYVSFAFLNHMGNSGPGTPWIGRDRATWILDADVIGCTETYVKSLVSHVNKYNGIAYKDTENIAFWELINEPDMLSYGEIKSYASCEAVYEGWLKDNGKLDSSASYAEFRTETVRNYINNMKGLLRSVGDNHLVCWGLNWHRYRNGNVDIFAGVAESDADIVAFCNYPGQDNAGSNYWERTYNFTDHDFSSWFREQRADENGYGWALSQDFASKAVIVYEFETFFNQSAYLYPLQATFFRSLRAQSASMWTYTFNEIAEYMGGSHFLNLRCTPGKMLSFLVAQEIFRTLPYKVNFSSTPNEQRGEHYVISKSHGGAIYSDSEKYINSCAVDGNWSPIDASPEVKFVAGCGNSPLVSYSGTGAYFIKENGNELSIRIMPDVNVTGDIFSGATYGKAKTELDYAAKNMMSVRLVRWADRPSTLYKVSSGTRKSCGHVAGSGGLRLSPGEYVLVADEQ